MYFFLLMAWSYMGAPYEAVIVNNSKEVGNKTLVFTQDLRFGAEEDGDEYLWVDGQAPVNFTVSPKGHIFIVDVKNSQILEFDTKGGFVGVFATRGEGPGEYQNLSQFQIFDDGSAVGFDSLQGTTKFSYYNQKLEYQNTELKTGFKEIITRPVYSNTGKFFFAWYMSFNTDTQELLFKTGMFDANRKLVKEFSSQKWPVPDQTRISDQEMWVDFLADQFRTLLNRGAIFARFLSNDQIMVADAKEYEIQIWDSAMQTHQKTIKKEYKPIAYTEADTQGLISSIEEIIFSQGGAQLANIITKNVIKRAVEKAEIPTYKNPLIDIIPMENEQYLAVRDSSFGDGTIMVEIFDKNGKCIGKADGPGKGISSFFGIRLQFKNGFAYAMEKTEDGDNQMVRYRYALK